jgi:hypothetical protein
MPDSLTPIEVFYSYAHEDEPFCHELEKHLSVLRRQGLIKEWYDRHIPPGSDWAQAVNIHLEHASVILLLISADFLASDYCYSIEMQRALERHQSKEACVIPILLRPVDWKNAPFAQLQALPTNGKPVTTWSNQDEAFADVAAGLRRAIENPVSLLNNEGSSMVIPSALNDLANTLQLQKRQPERAYNLLLTSTISLTPDVVRQICASGSWMKFRTYLHRIGADSSDLVHLLTKHVGIHNNLDGYRALAHLIKEGYFSTILTTNLDSTLEDTLLEIGLQPSAFQILLVGRDQDEYIAKALGGYPTGIRIIKLHGSLREGILPKQFPDFFELPITIRGSLSHCLNQDIVIVGLIKRDEDIMRVINASQKSRIYYVIPRKSSQDQLSKLIVARGNSLRSSLISGSYGDFSPFFRTLEAKLLSGTAF